MPIESNTDIVAETFRVHALYPKLACNSAYIVTVPNWLAYCLHPKWACAQKGPYAGAPEAAKKNSSAKG